MIKRLDKKGENILTENLLFIILNFVFLTILIVFLVSKVGSAAVLEEKYSKQIAMIIDSSRPVMEIKLDMENAIVEAGKNGVNKTQIVTINENVVNVNLKSGGKGYSYSFFNEVSVSAYPGTTKEDLTKYILLINPK